MPITTASDVFSLGVILYELLSGQRPFKSEQNRYQEIVDLILSEEPVRPSSAGGTFPKVCDSKLNTQTSVYDARETSGGKNEASSEIIDFKGLRGDLDNIILKSLRKESERRYQSVHELSEDIRRHLGGLPVTATADSTYYRLSKFVQRHRQGVSVATVIALLVFSISSLAVYQGIVANRERQKAEKRLVDIRNVAKSLVNETNDSLAKIPGNSAVRKALAEKSVEMLDSLASQETKDLNLLTELADAYTKLAGIQLWSFREFGKAIVNLKKSEVIYEKVLLASPDNIAVRRKFNIMLTRRIEALHSTNQREEMFKIAKAVIVNRQELIRLEPGNPKNIAELAAVHGWFGDKHLVFGRPAEAKESYKKGVETIELAIANQILKNNSPKAKAEFARLQYIKAWLMDGTGDSTKAIEIYLAAAKIAKEVFVEDSTIPGNFTRVIAGYESNAVIFEKLKDYQRALDSYLTARMLVDEAMKKRELPEYSNLLNSRCFHSVNAGLMSEKLGKKN